MSEMHSIEVRADATILLRRAGRLIGVIQPVAAGFSWRQPLDDTVLGPVRCGTVSTYDENS